MVNMYCVQHGTCCFLTITVVAEKNSGDLVKELLEMNEKARRTEELVEQMERER